MTEQVTFQDYSQPYTVRASAVLTTSYVQGLLLGPTQLVEGQNQLILYVNFTLGSLTDGRIRIEFSTDGVTFGRETFSAAPAAGLSATSLYDRQMTANGVYTFALPLKYQYVRISALGTGTVAGSLMAITAIVGTA